MVVQCIICFLVSYIVIIIYNAFCNKMKTGIFKSLISFLFKLSQLLSMHAVVEQDVSTTLFQISTSGIDFLPNELLKGDRTTGWIGSDFIRIAKVWLYVWRDYGTRLKNKLYDPDISAKKYSSKMCIAYLKLHNIDVPDKIADKRKAVTKHQQSMKCKSSKIKEMKINPIIISSYELAAQLMGSKQKNTEHVKMHYKQYLIELHEIDKIAKQLSNDTSKKPVWLSQHNNVNVMALIKDGDRSGKLEHMHDGKWFAEKGIQPMKKEVSTTKGKFAGNVIERIYANKTMNYLTNEDECGENSKCDLSNYVIKSYELLMEKLKRGLPVPFVLGKDEKCLFLISGNKACNFSFSNHVATLMGLNYFGIKHVMLAETPLSMLKNGDVEKCALLSTKVEGSSTYCYTALTNNWLSLNKAGKFRVMNEFNYK